MQAILTKYIPATNRLSSRIKATCGRGKITVSYPHDLSGDACHIYAADLLVARFVAIDAKQYGSNPTKNPWSKPRVIGTLASGEVAHVFTS